MAENFTYDPEADERSEARRNEVIRHRRTEYQGSSRVLRAWFIAYGVGGPAILVTSNVSAASNARVGLLVSAVVLFLLGVSIQIIGAIADKSQAKRVHLAEWDEHADVMPRRAWLNWASTIGADIFTLIAFLMASVLVGIMLLLPDAAAQATSCPAVP